MKLGKLIVVAGLTYAVGSVARAVFEAPGTALFLTGIGIILILIFGLFDWTYYDDVIRIVLVAIGWVCLAAVIGLFMAGRWGLAFSAVISCCTSLWKPVCRWSSASWVGGIRQSADLSSGWNERAAMSNYSPTDGYCHFDHEHYEDLLATDNPNGHGYVERKVPPSLSGHGPADGALANVQRLKEQVAAATSLPEPHGFFASLAKRYHAHPWLWWIAIATVVWWTIKKAVRHVR